jgi:alkylation response protein AidB-like acyl-CoA dehydrogenase
MVSWAAVAAVLPAWCSRTSKVPKENLLGELHQGVKIFNTMMIPERLGTAAMTIGAATPAVDVATGYTTKRKAFGRPVAAFQGVSFQVAEAVTLLDASRSMIYTTARAVDAEIDEKRIRRLVSQSKKFVTESCQRAVHNAMQVMGGIGYTNIYPVERIFRDLRLASIWTGTNEVMSMIIANEWYKEYWKMKKAGKIRDMETDAAESDAKDEKIFE